MISFHHLGSRLLFVAGWLNLLAAAVLIALTSTTFIGGHP